MKVKITKQTTVEIIPVQKRRCPTGGKPQQSKIFNTIKIIAKTK